MYFDMTMQSAQYINTLEEPAKILIYLFIYVEIPLICIILYVFDKK